MVLNHRLKVIDEAKTFESIVVDRSLTEEEQTLARWMLENGTPQAVIFLPQLEKARVCRLCGCGCASVDFKIDGYAETSGDLGILGDFLFGEGDETCGAFIFEREGVLSGLEVFSYGVKDKVDVLPNPSELRSYDG